MAELVDALDLGSSIERCGSSSLPIRTILGKLSLYSETTEGVDSSDGSMEYLLLLGSADKLGLG